MGASNKNTRIALGISIGSALFILIAFVSPYWLVNDGKLANPKFTNLGLWVVCFNHFHDIHRFYDTPFNGCMWVFEEEYYIIHDYLLPGFYIAVQFFATLCFVACLVAIPLTLAFLRCSRDDDRYVLLLLTLGAIEVFGSICGFLSVVVFGAKGDSRDWMPHWEHNGMGWAFALACIGSVLLLPAGILYMVEARRERYKRLNEIGNREVTDYTHDYKTRRYGEGVQTDI